MNRFLEFLKQAVAKLGLESKFAAKELTAEEQKSLIAAYEEASGTKFAEDLAAYQAAQKEAAETQAMAEAFKELASIFGKEVTSQTNAEEVISNIKASIDEMKATISRLGSMSQGEEPQKTLNGPRISISGAHTKEFAFGVQHPMFASGKRWNRIAITGRRDNEASDETAQIVSGYNERALALWGPTTSEPDSEGGTARAEYLRMETNTGGSGGFSEGVRRAFDLGAEWFWVMDDDVAVEPDGLETLARWSEEAEAVMGQRRDFDGGHFFWQHRFWPRLAIYNPARESATSSPTRSASRAGSSRAGWSRRSAFPTPASSSTSTTRSTGTWRAR